MISFAAVIKTAAHRPQHTREADPKATAIAKEQTVSVL